MHAEAISEKEKKADRTLIQSKALELMGAAADKLKVEFSDSIRKAYVS